jgi:hypothetical protein
MNPKIQFADIAKALEMPSTEGTISTYVKKELQTIVATEIESQTDQVIIETLNGLREIMEEATATALASSNPEIFNSAANLANTIFKGAKMLRDASPKTKGKSVTNNTQINFNGFDDAVKAAKLIS